MSAFPGIDPIVTRLSQITSENDVGSMLLVAAIVAALGAGFGLLLVWARSALARRASLGDPTSRALARMPADPEATLRFRWVRATAPSWEDIPAPCREAGDAWLKGYIARLRLVMPGLKNQVPVGPVPYFEVAPALPGALGDGPVRQGATSPDATTKIDARILSRIVKDIDIVQSDPITLILGSGEPLSPDATVKTPALSMKAMEAIDAEDWQDVGNFQYGARRS
jgi:hypothetical protein